MPKAPVVVFRKGAEVAFSAAVVDVAFRNGALVVLSANSAGVVDADTLSVAEVVVLRNRPVDVALTADTVLVMLWLLMLLLVCPTSSTVVLFVNRAVLLEFAILLVEFTNIAVEVEFANIADDVEFANPPLVDTELWVWLISEGPLDRILLIPEMATALVVVSTPPNPVEDGPLMPSDKKLERLKLDEFVGKAVVEFANAPRVVLVKAAAVLLLTTT